MTGIPHKQARDYINAALDGMLNDQEQKNLDDHLNICKECRTYAVELNSLDSRIQQAFLHRSESLPGPSDKLVQNVQSHTRTNMMTNRIDLGLRTLAGLAVLVVLGILVSSMFRQLSNSSKAINAPQSPVSSSQESNRLIAFVSAQEGNSEIYVMNADGSGVRNITNDPAYDGNAFWSPDGSKLAFESDRNGSLDIFVMNADGSGLTQLTHDPANDILGALPQTLASGVIVPDIWSPDGSHILYSNDHGGNWALHVMSADGSGATQLTQAGDPPVRGTLWSPDGRQIAYTVSDANGSGRIVVINIDGSDRREIAAADPAKGDNGWQTIALIAWSQDRRSIYYEYTTRDGTWYIQKANANGATTSQEITSGYALVQGLPIGSAWQGNDEGLNYITQQVGGKYGFAWLRTDGGKALHWDSLVICGIPSNNFTDAEVPLTSWAASKAGSELVMLISCPKKGFTELYSQNANTTALNEIAQIPKVWSSLNISWSADDQMVLFQGTDKSGKTDLYVLRMEDLQNKSPNRPALIRSGESSEAHLQPVPFTGFITKGPSTTSPPLRTILVSTPLWTGASNGNLIAYVSNADGNSDIYLARSDGSNVTNLTHRPADDFSPVWSPDGNWIAFASGFNGDYSLHIMRPDGSGEKRIADVWWNFNWSPDSNKIAYLVSQPDEPSVAYSPAKTSLKVIDLDGNILQDTYLGVYNQVDQLRWSQDGKSLFYVATQMSTDNSGVTRATESDIDQINLRGGQPMLLVKSDQQIDAWIGKASNLTYLARDILTWNLIHNNGRSSTRVATWDLVSNQCRSSAPFNWDNISSSASRRWSPDGRRLLIEATCPNDNTTWFYLGSIDGTFIKLLNYPVLSNSVAQDSVGWSPDGRSIIFSSDLGSVGNSDIYILDVETALKDPSARPVRITATGFYESSPDWQPKP